MSACASDSSHYPSANNIMNKLHQLGFTRHPTSDKAKCLLMLLNNICSRVLQHMQVSDTGL